LIREYDIEPRWIAFPLHPNTPEAGLSLEELFAGRGIDVGEAMMSLKRTADQFGLAVADRTMTFNSRKAQELGKWAESRGRGQAFHDAVFRAYFAEARNISELSVLEDITAAIGLDPNEVSGILKEKRYAAEVDRDWEYCRERRIRAVPSFSAGGRLEVGAKPYETLAALVKEAGARPCPANP
jgi:predicted DsbA family dithiol-disulfide isomerase